jgi:hypothetical protein
VLVAGLSRAGGKGKVRERSQPAGAGSEGLCKPPREQLSLGVLLVMTACYSLSTWYVSEILKCPSPGGHSSPTR